MNPHWLSVSISFSLSYPVLLPVTSPILFTFNSASSYLSPLAVIHGLVVCVCVCACVCVCEREREGDSEAGLLRPSVGASELHLFTVS